MSKEKLEKYIRRLQGIVKKLRRKNYYLKQEDRVLRGLIRNYKD